MAQLVKNPPALDTRDTGLMPDMGRSPGEGSGNPLQYSYLKNPMDRAAWQDKVHRVTEEPDMTEHTHTLTHSCNSSNCKTKKIKLSAFLSFSPNLE